MSANPGRPRIAAAAALLLPALAITFLAAGESTLWADRSITIWVQDHLPAWLEPATDFTNWFGRFHLVAPFVVVFATALAFVRRPAEALLALSSLTAWPLNNLLKRAVRSPRPEDLQVVEVSGWGFPSGHVMGLTVVAIVLVYIVLRGRARPAWRPAVGTAIIAFSFIVGLGRVHVGAHWPSDVLGAWLWSGILSLLLIMLYERRSKALSY